MAENDLEKTEQPTPHRLQEARKDGNVAKSTDLSAACVLMAAVLVLGVLGMHMFSQLRHVIEASLSSAHAGNLLRPDDVGAVLVFSGKQFALALAPIVPILALVALTATLGQVGFLLTAKPITPKLSKISPIQGVKRLFSIRAVVRLAMSLLKVALIAAVAMAVIHSELPGILKLSQLAPMQALAAAGSIVFSLSLKLAALLLILAIIDYSYERWQRTRDLRMSKQDIKDEMKRMDGDPLIKQQRARVARQLAMQRIAQAVPQADVIVTNPTHYAVALRYDAESMNAPKVIAKGADFMAMRIRQIAIAHGIPLVERKTLAQALFKHVDIGREVPSEFYSAVAEIMAYVYRLSRRSA